MNARLIALIVAASLLASPLAATEEHAEDDRFRLWANCQSVGLSVTELSKHAKAIGLTKEAVEVSARSRLRAARLYNATKYIGLLTVTVNVVGHDGLRNETGNQPFNVTVEYYKLMTDVLSGIKMPATAWNSTTAGLGDSPYILSVVSQNTDKFIDEYLRVNRDACE